METTNNTYKYFAFISYNSKDQKWGKRIQRKLEHYRMPSTLCSERGWKRAPMKPIFFAPTDIQPGGLTEELKQRLEASKNLIVVCSPNSAQSKWVGKEIAYFHELGRSRDIHFFIVDGEPHSGNPETECFNPIIEELGMPEILGVNIHEKVYRYPWLNRERAYVQLITKMLNVEFDSIWQRHKRLKIQQALMMLTTLIVVAVALVSVWILNRPVDIRMQAVEASVHNTNLPSMKEAVVTLQLENEVKTDTISSIQETALFKNIPHSFLNKEVRVTVQCRNFHPIDTLLTLTENVQLNLYRNPAEYGDIRIQIYDFNTGKGVPNIDVQIEEQKTQSDAEGFITLSIPLAEQKTAYYVTCDKALEDDTIRMPLSEGAVLLTK